MRSGPIPAMLPPVPITLTIGRSFGMVLSLP